MTQFDLESFRDYFIQLFKDNLSAEITAINNEKSDGLTLAALSDDQYISDFNEKVMNFEQFLFYGFQEVRTIIEPNMQGYALEATVAFEIGVNSREGGDIEENKILRYTRAMLNVVLNNQSHPNIGSFTVEALAPITLKMNKNSICTKLGGIQITGTIG